MLIGMTAKRKIEAYKEEPALDFDLQISALSNRYMCSETCPCSQLSTQSVDRLARLSEQELKQKY